MTWPDAIASVADLSVLGALAFTWRTFLREMRRDRDFWRRMALRGTGLAEQATDVAAQSVAADPKDADEDA